MGLIGIIPCAGRAERFGGIPKFLLPVPHATGTLIGLLCHRMKVAGAEQILVGSSPENRDLIERFTPPGTIVYSVISSTMSETLLAARRWSGKDDVLFGMADSYWAAANVYGGLVRTLNFYPKAEAAAALWTVHRSQANYLGMVRVASSGVYPDEIRRVAQVVDKPQSTSLDKAWGALAWRASFWDFIQSDDPTVGFALTRALAANGHIAPTDAKGEYHDCGTPERYWALCGYWAGNKPQD